MTHNYEKLISRAEHLRAGLYASGDHWFTVRDPRQAAYDLKALITALQSSESARLKAEGERDGLAWRPIETVTQGHLGVFWGPLWRHPVVGYGTDGRGIWVSASGVDSYVNATLWAPICAPSSATLTAGDKSRDEHLLSAHIPDGEGT